MYELAFWDHASSTEPDKCFSFADKSFDNNFKT